MGWDSCGCISDIFHGCVETKRGVCTQTYFVHHQDGHLETQDERDHLRNQLLDAIQVRVRV